MLILCACRSCCPPVEIVHCGDEYARVGLALSYKPVVLPGIGRPGFGFNFITALHLGHSQFGGCSPRLGSELFSGGFAGDQPPRPRLVILAIILIGYT